VRGVPDRSEGKVASLQWKSVKHGRGERGKKPGGEKKN